MEVPDAEPDDVSVALPVVVVEPVCVALPLEERVALLVPVWLRVGVGVEVGVWLDERVRVPVVEAVDDTVAVALRLVLGETADVDGGSTTPRSCWPGAAVATTLAPPVRASMRYTVVALLA